MAPSNKKAATAKAVTPAAAPSQEKVVNPPPPVNAAATAETTALAKNMESAPAALGVPDWLAKEMGGAAPLGFDKMDAADFILPRLVLAQGQTPEVAQKNSNGYGIEVGDIFDNLTKQILCKAGEKLEVIPVILGKSRMYFGDFDKGEGVLCRADDALTSRKGGMGKDEGDQPTTDCMKCVFREFDEEDGAPACSVFYNIIVLLPAFGLPAYVWSNKHTGVKVAKRFLSTARAKGTDMFAQRYTLEAITESNDRFTFQNFTFSPVGWATKDQYLHAKKFFLSLEGKTWTPNTEDLDAAEGGEAPAEPGSDAGEGEVVDSTATPVVTKEAATPPAAAEGEDAF